MNNMEYLTTQEASEKWNISLRYVQKLLAAGKVEGAVKVSRTWLIPADARKPDNIGCNSDHDRISKPHLEGHMLIEAIRFAPGTLEEKINAITDTRKQHQALCELAYLRGDFKAGLSEYHTTDPSDPMRVYILNLACLCAISTGDYVLFGQIDGELKEKASHTDLNPEDKKILELSIVLARVSMYASDYEITMDDITALPAEVRFFGMYLYAKMLHQEGKYERLIGVVQGVLALSPTETCSVSEIYLCLLCGGSFLVLGNAEKALYYLKKALEMGLSDGLITPFAELYTVFPGMMKQTLRTDYPEWYQQIFDQGQRILANWIGIHNRYAKDHVTNILTLEEYNIAVFAVNGKTNAQIAGHFNMSVSSVKRKLEGIYARLLIGSRQELTEFVRWNSD
ncbi:MAG: hypothetical protein ACOYB8_06835 [Eubacteriaceae bacterium]|jgi:excisionase family DNA binding protein